MKTTDKHFQLFKKECRKWIARFGLLGWRFYFQHEDLPDGKQIAYCIYPEDLADRVFTLGLSVDLGDLDETEMDIRRSGFHEVMEAFLYRMNFLAKSRDTHPEEIEEENHNLIRTLENVVFAEEE